MLKKYIEYIIYNVDSFELNDISILSELEMVNQYIKLYK